MGKGNDSCQKCTATTIPDSIHEKSVPYSMPMSSEPILNLFSPTCTLRGQLFRSSSLDRAQSESNLVLRPEAHLLRWKFLAWSVRRGGCAIKACAINPSLPDSTPSGWEPIMSRPARRCANTVVLAPYAGRTSRGDLRRLRKVPDPWLSVTAGEALLKRCPIHLEKDP